MSLTIPGQIIVVEGADATGKSSFIARMAQLHLEGGTPVPRVFHNTADDAKLPGSLYRHYRAQLLDAVHFRERGISTYIDRSFLSEHIYGKLYRGKPRIGAFEVRTLERLADKHGIILLGLIADQAIRKDRILERGEEWTLLDGVVGANYFQHFRDNQKSWVIADSTSAPVIN